MSWQQFLSRRDWLRRNARMAAALSAAVPLRRACPADIFPGVQYRDPAVADRIAMQASLLDPGPLQALAQRAIDAARAAGARYADARLTRSVGHVYDWQQGVHRFSAETEVQGIGVRALVDGYWGFAASAMWDGDAAVRLARDAVAQAKINATVSVAGRGNGKGRTVELAPVPAVTGTWIMPVAIDPFAVPVEEKLDHIVSWDAEAARYGLSFPFIFASVLKFIRQESVLATTDGTLVSQTTYQTGGVVQVQQTPNAATLKKLEMAGRGWELILDAKISDQLVTISDEFARRNRVGSQRLKLVTVGRYPLVCDGATMTALLGQTLATATQLDRALGYEANASGTSYLNDPLAMLGTFHVASPAVTVTANRSVSGQLATVKWDDEGVIPEDVTLIKNGVLVDYQTTREQATWLASYYDKARKPVRSHGCAAAESALQAPLQMPPNLTLTPSAEPTRLEDLAANVSNGLLVTGASVSIDFQGRTGLMWPSEMREIKNGRVGDVIAGGAIQFDSLDLWRKVTAVGGAGTAAVAGHASDSFIIGGYGNDAGTPKGEPPQSTPYTIQSVAALVQAQAVIDARRSVRSVRAGRSL